MCLTGAEGRSPMQADAPKRKTKKPDHEGPANLNREANVWETSRAYTRHLTHMSSKIVKSTT